MITYSIAREIFRTAPAVCVPIHLHTGRNAWFKVDKDYILEVTPESELPYLCYIEIENDGEVFLHPKIEND